MSDPASFSRVFLRRPRRATEVVLGADGRLTPGDRLTGLASDDPEQLSLAAQRGPR